jgi:2-oxoisovalerate dehydrogenase E1 component
VGPLHAVLPRGGPTLTQDGVDCELIDLRTIVPPDMDAVLASVRKTGRLLVVHEDRVFSSLGREIQGAVHEALGGEHVITRVLGQDAVPGIPSPIARRGADRRQPREGRQGRHELLAIRKAPAVREPARGGVHAPQVLWTPNRNFVT